MSKTLEAKKSSTTSKGDEEKKKPNLVRTVWTVIMGFVTVCMVAGTFAGLGSNIINKPAITQSANSGPVVIGTVNNLPLNQDDFNRMVGNLEQMEGQSIPAQEVPMMRSYVLDQLIEGKLLESQASKLNITVSDDDIQAERTKDIASNGLAKTLSLSATATQAEIDNALTTNGSPTTEVMFPDDKLRSQLLQQKVKAAIAAQTVVTEADARAYYTDYHTQHILIGNKTRSDAQAQLMAQKITALAAAPGANFAALAKQYSEDPGTKNTGGDDGWINKQTRYVPEFLTAAFALKSGQVTQTPVSSPTYGYFIIKCLGVRSSLPKDFDKNKVADIATVQQQESGQNYTTYIANLKKDPSTKIVITDPRLIADRAMGSISTLGDPGAVNMAYKTALTNYLLAENNKDLSITDKGEIDTAIAQIYTIQHDSKDELTYLTNAANETKDPNITVQLGQLYLQNKDDNDAIAQFKSASTIAWSDPQIHYQLLGIYKTMKRPDLAQSETQWLTTYTAQQKAQQASQPGGAGGPGGIQMMPAGGQPGGAAPQVTTTPTTTSRQPHVVLVPSGASTTPAKPAQ